MSWLKKLALPLFAVGSVIGLSSAKEIMHIQPAQVLSISQEENIIKEIRDLDSQIKQQAVKIVSISQEHKNQASKHLQVANEHLKDAKKAIGQNNYAQAKEATKMIQTHLSQIVALQS